jgi:deazaflavin-dependent oxidoreductase (nitroreductase family)
MNQTMESEQIDQVVPTIKTFPTEGTNLSKILSDQQYRQSFHAQLKQYNPLIVALYKIGLLPLFGVSRTVMLLTTRGRKSRKQRSIPIGYWRIGGIVHLFSAWGKATSWYKNMKACPENVWIQIGLRRWAVQPQELTDPNEILRTIAQFINESPAQAQYLFGWDPGSDRLDQADFSTIIHRVLIVRFIEKNVKG